MFLSSLASLCMYVRGLASISECLVGTEKAVLYLNIHNAVQTIRSKSHPQNKVYHKYTFRGF